MLTVNGSEEGFDGFRIGVNGFDNPLRDTKTEEFKEQIGKGCKLKMDDSGNILVKRLSRSNIYVKNTMEENAVRRKTDGRSDHNSRVIQTNYLSGQ